MADETDLNKKTEIVSREAAPLAEQENTLLRIIEQEVAISSSSSTTNSSTTNPISGSKDDELAADEFGEQEFAPAQIKNPGAIDSSGKSLIGASISGAIIVRSLIGSGGMSSVYKAWHSQIDREVAVKVMHPHLLSEENALLRFQQEAHAAGKLDHPNIVRVHDFRAGEQGISYLVMDLVDGIALDAELDNVKHLSEERAVKVFTQACDALAHAHAKGVIHRDLKPSNMMLTTNEVAPDQVRILDFGIAKVLPQEGDKRAKLTQTGEVFGSPLYMSPEQCMGKNLDHRSDIYSMGCLLYEALTGKPPLEGANAFETFFKHTTEMPASLKEHRKDLEYADEFDAIILKAMAKAPADRYQSMAEFKADLEKIGRNSSRGWLDKAKDNVELAKRKHGARGGRLSKPVMAAIYTFAILCVLAISTVAVSYFQSQSVNLSSSWDDLYQQAQKNIDSGKYDLAKAQLEKALEVSGASRDQQTPILRELVDMERAQGISTNNAYAQKLKSIESTSKQNALEELDELCDTLSRVSRSLTADSARELDSISHEINQKVGNILINDPTQWAKGREALTQVKSALEKRNATNTVAYARTTHNIAQTSYLNEKYAEAAAGFTESRKLYEQRATEDRANTKHLLNSMEMQGRALRFSGRQDQAEQVFKERLDVARKTDANSGNFINNPLLAQAYFVLADLYTYKMPSSNLKKNEQATQMQESIKKAERNLQEAIRIYGNLETPNKNELANCYSLLGQIQIRQGHLQDAQDSFLQSKDLFQSMRQKNSGFWLLTLVGLADTYFGQQKYDKAEPLYRHAVAIGARYVPQHNLAIDNAISKLEQIVDKRDKTGVDRQKDLPMLMDLRKMKLDLDQQQYGKVSEQVVSDYLNLCALSRSRSDLDSARTYLDQAISTAEKLDNLWAKVRTYHVKARFEFDSSNPDKGREYLEKTIAEIQKAPKSELKQNHLLLELVRADLQTRPGISPSLLQALDVAMRK